MSNLAMVSSVDDVDTRDEPQEGTFGAAMPNFFLPPPTNYAEDENIKTWVKQELYDICAWTRQDRLTLQEEWHAIREMVMLFHGTNRRYFGDSDYYIPVYARNKASLLSSYSRGLFPSDEYIDVGLFKDTAANVAQMSTDADALKLYMQWELDVNARARTKMKEFLGQYVDYGVSPLKVMYKKAKRVVGVVGADNSARFQGCNYDGLSIKACNLFNWYIYPTTASELDEAMLVFEDIEIPRAFAEQMVRDGKWVKDAIQLLEHASEISEAANSQQRMMDSRSGTQRPTMNGLQGKQAERFVVTECWTFAELPSQAYIREVDEKGAVLPTRIVMTAGGDALSAIRNPHFHQKPPYLVARANNEPGFFYGYNHGKMTQPLQCLTNDAANQMNDNGTYALNPIAIFNPSMMHGPPPPLRPGVAMYALDVEKAVKFDRPPFEQVHLGINLMQMWLGMGQDLGGAPPIMQGATGGKAAKTATGAQLAQKNAQTPIQDLVEDIETSVLIPLLDMVHFNAQQYREEEVMAAVAGKSFKVTPEQLRLRATFRWMASSQAVNNQVRAQQAISLMQAVAPLVPLLMQQGKVVNFDVLVRKVYSDGFGFRGFEEFIAQTAQPAMATGGMPPQNPEQAAAIQGEQGDRVRSSLEQLYGEFGNPTEAQPGEAEEFMNVRNEADQIAAMMGGAQ